MEAFARCRMEPLVDQEGPSAIQTDSNGLWKVSSFFLDSSGRSSVFCPVRITCQDEQHLQQILDLNGLQIPSNKDKNDTGQEEKDDQEVTADDVSENHKFSLDVQAKVSQAAVGNTGQATLAQVEQVEILSTRIEGDRYIVIDTVLYLKVAQSRDKHGLADVKAVVAIEAVLQQRQVDSADLDKLPQYFSLGQAAFSESNIIRKEALQSFQLHILLTHAFSVQTKACSGPNMGQTTVMLTMRHADTHDQNVVITSIAMHPGHSISTDESIKAKEKVVVDMTKCLMWKYMDGCEPRLPLLMKQGESYSTIIAIDAVGDTQCRRFVSPISVTASVGHGNLQHRHTVLAATEVKWISSRALTEPANAFRVDMTIDQDEYPIGAPMTLPISITNLSSQVRNISMSVQDGKKAQAILLGETEDGRKGSTTVTISEHHTDLLSIDRVLRLRDLKPHGTVQCEWRFTPLKTGLIDIPNFRLVDVSSGHVFFCVHNTRIVGKSS